MIKIKECRKFMKVCKDCEKYKDKLKSILAEKGE